MARQRGKASGLCRTARLAALAMLLAGRWAPGRGDGQAVRRQFDAGLPADCSSDAYLLLTCPCA